MNSDVSLRKLSQISEDLYGTKIPFTTISQEAQRENWATERELQISTRNIPTKEKMETISDKLYEAMTNESDPLPHGLLASMAKAWMDINTKVNIGTGNTVKTDAQSVKDMIAKQIAENNQ